MIESSIKKEPLGESSAAAAAALIWILRLQISIKDCFPWFFTRERGSEMGREETRQFLCSSGRNNQKSRFLIITWKALLKQGKVIHISSQLTNWKQNKKLRSGYENVMHVHYYYMKVWLFGWFLRMVYFLFKTEPLDELWRRVCSILWLMLIITYLACNLSVRSKLIQPWPNQCDRFVRIYYVGMSKMRQSIVIKGTIPKR